MEPLRVLFTARHLDHGGVTKHMTDLGSRLVERGHHVAIASNGPRLDSGGKNISEVEALGLRHFVVPFPRPGDGRHPLNSSLSAARALGRVVDDFEPKLLHVAWRSTSPFAQLLRITHGIPFMSTLHSSDIPSSRLLRQLSFWGRPAIAISEETRVNLVKDFGVPEARVRTIVNGADERHFRVPSASERTLARSALGVHHDGFTIVVVARLMRVKGQDIVLRAMRDLVQAVPNAMLLLAGADYGFEAELRAVTSALGLEGSVRFLGHTDPLFALWASDVFVLTSHQEGFAIVVPEAMLCGLPVIRTPAGGALEQIIEGENGYVVPFDDPATLAHRLLEYSRDSALRAEHARSATVTAQERFTLKAMTNAYLDAYLDAIHGGNTGKRPPLPASHYSAQDQGKTRQK